MWWKTRARCAFLHSTRWIVIIGSVEGDALAGDQLCVVRERLCCTSHALFGAEPQEHVHHSCNFVKLSDWQMTTFVTAQRIGV